mmetsp:Transcript_28771/g.77932  ORF Transcript_28771/g.77932 Transcript_28771/m.77932 type:complete len:244 (+) Transcript_28771:1068-1799(+)
MFQKRALAPTITKVPATVVSSPNWLLFLDRINDGPVLPLRSKPTYVPGTSNTLQERPNLIELPVSWIVNEGRTINSIFRMEKVRVRRVVNDNRFRQVSVQDRQVLHVISLVKDTGLPEQSVADHLLWIQQIQEWVCVLVETGCVYDNLVVFRHFDQKLVHAGTFHDVYTMNDFFDLDRNDKIGSFYGSETRMYQGFVEIQYQTLLPGIVGMDCTQQPWAVEVILHNILGVVDIVLRILGVFAR